MDTTEIEKNIQSLKKKLINDPEDKKTLHQLADLYYQIGCFDTSAREVYERIIKDKPRDVRFQKALSISLLLDQIYQIPQEIHEMSEVDRRVILHNIEHLKSMVVRQPENVTIRQALANLLLFVGEIDQAIEEYKRCLQFGTVQIFSLKNFLEFVNTNQIELTTDQMLFFADLFRRGNEEEDAFKILLDLYKKGERRPEILEPLVELLNLFIEELNKQSGEDNRILCNEYLRLLTDIYLYRNELLNAVSTLGRIDLKKLKDYSTVKRVAQMLIKYGDFSGAFNLLSKMPLDDEAKSLINQMTLDLEKRGELDTATYLLQFINQNDITIKEINENRWRQLEIRAEIGLANLYFKKKNYPQALAKFLSVIEHGFQDINEFSDQLDYLVSRISNIETDVLKKIGSIYMTEKNFYKAAEYYNKVIERQPEDHESSVQLRIIYDHILEVAPQLGELRIRSGDLYLLENNLEKALSEYQEASNNPLTRIKAQKKISEIYFKMGNIQMALDNYKDLPIVEDDLPQIYNIMQVLINNGNYRSAKEAGELIVQLKPDYRDTKQVMEQLDTRERDSLPIEEQDKEIQQLIGGHSLGRYSMTSKIASGGMGVIYKVFDKKLGRFAAMKILREELSSSGRALERFFREARIAASINHENIVDIYDYNISHTAGQSYISMEYIEGQSLRQIIEDKFMHTPQPSQNYVTRILYYMSQLCSALSATHDKGIIHRDIKPDNIMITKDEKVKITDFGIVHIERATFTPTGALIGTPRYMSPEQVRGAKIDGRADIYAVGIVMYECLLGSPPFIAGDIAYQQVNIDPPEPKGIMPSIPDSVNEIIMKCFQKNPDDRFQSAAELKISIDEAICELGGYEPVKDTTRALEEKPKIDLESDLDL